VEGEFLIMLNFEKRVVIPHQIKVDSELYLTSKGTLGVVTYLETANEDPVEVEQSFGELVDFVIDMYSDDLDAKTLHIMSGELSRAAIRMRTAANEIDLVDLELEDGEDGTTD